MNIKSISIMRIASRRRPWRRNCPARKRSSAPVGNAASAAMPDGEYIFGPREDGEPIVRRDGVGVMPDGSALASGVMGMDHMVRTIHRLTGVPLWEVIRMASLTPARIAGWDADIGSIEVGKRADLVWLDDELDVKGVWIAE